MLKSIIAGIVGALAFYGVSFAQTCPAYPYTLTNGATADASQVMANFTTVRNCATAIPIPRGYISGLTLSTAGSSGTFGVSAGGATDNTGASLMTLPSSVTKTTGAWAAGSGNGCGATAAGWYSEFLIQRVDTGAVDVLCSTSATVPTLPSPYTLFRRIGSMKANGSVQWIAFTQLGDKFIWTTAAQDIAAVSSGTTPVSYALSVPPGVNVTAMFNAASGSASVGTWTIFYSPLQTAQNAGLAGSTYYSAPGMQGSSGYAQVVTDTAQHVQVQASQTLNQWVSTQGWIDTRGKDN